MLLTNKFVVRGVENYDKDVVDTGAIEMISDEEESPIQISRLEASGMLDQLLHVTVIPRSLLKNKGNPGH